MGAKIFNSNLTKEIIDGAKLQQNLGGIPSEIAEKVIPVMEVNPKLLRVNNIVRGNISTGTSTVLYNIDSNEDFYLTSASISNSKTAADSNTNCYIGVVLPQESGTRALLYLAGTTLTAESGQLCLNFNPPILLKRASTILLNRIANNGTTAGSITGYSVRNINA